jgi:DNA polymerase III epsilon subunit-like protein
MASKDFILFDFETGGINPHTCQPTQLAAIALDGRNFRVKGTFNSEIRAVTDNEKAIAAGLAPLEEEALKVTGKTREAIDKAPSLESVWPKFVSFVEKSNWNKTSFFAPIAVGYNIIGYDMIIIDRLCKQFGQYDEKRQQQTIFNPIYKIDMLHNLFMWTEGDPSIKSLKMDNVRKITGLSSENAHDALQDVKDVANVFIRFMYTHREVYKKMKFQDMFQDGELYVR